MKLISLFYFTNNNWFILPLHAHAIELFISSFYILHGLEDPSFGWVRYIIIIQIIMAQLATINIIASHHNLALGLADAINGRFKKIQLVVIILSSPYFLAHNGPGYFTI